LSSYENNYENVNNNAYETREIEKIDFSSELVEKKGDSVEEAKLSKKTELIEDYSSNNEVLDETGTNESIEDMNKEKTIEVIRAEINEKSTYSLETNAYMNSVEELEIYQKARLEEVSINGRICLVRNDIDMNLVVDDFGMTNADLIKEGYAPLDENGRRIELHHIGQKDDAPLAELKFEEHRSQDTYSILHDTAKESEINRTRFDNERQAHWEARSIYR